VYFKRCPQCEGEYQYTVSQCADCGVALEDAPVHQQRDTTPLPDASQLVGLRTGAPLEMADLAEALQRAGIGSRIDSDPPGRGFGRYVSVYVRERDYEAAHQVDHEVFASRTPEAAELDPPATADTGACPACGASLAQDAASCRECGLEFPEG
jgi:predicted amidophosphoribosyltransferase